MTEQWPNQEPMEAEVLSAGPRRNRGRGFAIGTAFLAGGVVLGVVGIAGATSAPKSRTELQPAAQAQSTTPSPSAGAATPAPDRRGMPGMPGREFGGRGFGGHGRGGPGMMMGGGALHGEFVTQKSGGGYQAVQVQRGTATSVSAASITVKSADGFTRTYAVNKDTRVNKGGEAITTIAVNAAVHVHATGAGDKATATAVIDDKKMLADRDKFAPKREVPSAGATKSSA